ncbi:MAG: MFS transporter [Candidatus Latescibacterota bacterium]|nr:MFS transporter [Candidatus Latescibacterota bacterium]
MTENSTFSSRLTGTLQPLGIPDYRRLLLSNTLWWQAMWMEMIVIGWLVLDLTDSPFQVALVGFYRSIPLLVWGYFSGPVIDRIGRRRIMLISQSINFTTSVVIATLLWTSQLAFWHLCTAAFLMGTAWSFGWPARRSYLPDLVGKARTIDAMLLENFTSIISRIAGPFLGGRLIYDLGPAGCYLVLATFSGIALLTLTRLTKLPAKSVTTEGNPFRVVIEGLRYVRRNEPIFGSFLITVFMNYLTFSYMTLLPVFARDILGQGPVGLGYLGMGNGIGAMCGMFVINGLRGNVPSGLIFGVGAILQSAALVAFSQSTIFGLSFFFLVCSGIGQAAFSVMQSSIVLTKASDEMRSRVMGSIVLGIGAGPPGRLQIGALAENFGAPFALGSQTLVCAILCLTTTLILHEFRQTRESAPPARSD